MGFEDSLDTIGHPAFRVRSDAGAAARQLRLSIVVAAVLVLAIGLCASVVTPRSGWRTLDVAAYTTAISHATADARSPDAVPHGG